MDFILRLGVDRIIVMDSGRILMEGASDEVRSNKSVIDAYLGSSME
jgi:ABC-type branched-subunit amino acid transport system ATPase component